jgi:hypothetical protein
MMLTTAGQSLDIFVSRLDKSLLRGLKFLVRAPPPRITCMDHACRRRRRLEWSGGGCS